MPSQQDSVTVRAVCVLKNGENNNIQGVIRFAQMIGMNQMKITGELQGLPTDRKLTFRVHEYGDLSSGPISTGGRFNPEIKAAHPSKDQMSTNEGEYGKLQVGSDGQAKIDLIDNRLTLFGPSSIIGRSVVVTDEREEDFTRVETEDNKGTISASGNRLAAGVIGICQ
jgi:Cu-Zn family superoxide dismutase